jgi:hypothetical protein
MSGNSVTNFIKSGGGFSGGASRHSGNNPEMALVKLEENLFLYLYLALTSLQT